MHEPIQSISTDTAVAYQLIPIEVDLVGALHYYDNPIRPLKAFLPNDTIYVGTFGKILAPGYDTGWVAGGRYTDDILRCCFMGAAPQPLIVQHTIASYLKQGGMNRHLRRLRTAYHKAMRLLQGLVARHFPDGTRTTHPAGGNFLWVELPAGYDAVKMVRMALAENMFFASGILFSSRQHYKNCLRLNCTGTCDNVFVTTVQRLGELASDCFDIA